MPAPLLIRRPIFRLPLQGFCRSWLGVSGFKLLIPLPWRAGLPRWGRVFLWKNNSLRSDIFFRQKNPPPPRRRQRFLGGSVTNLFVGGCRFFGRTISCTVQHSVQEVFYGRY